MRLAPYGLRVGANARALIPAHFYQRRLPLVWGCGPGNPRCPAKSPQFSPAIDPPRYSEMTTVAWILVDRPLYILHSLLACRVGRMFRARTLRRDEYPALSAQIRSPNLELNAKKFRHSAALPISTDVYIGDM